MRKKNGGKLYVAESVEDLISNFNKVEHSNFGYADFLIFEELKIFLLTRRSEYEIKKTYYNIGPTLPYTQTEFPYISAEFFYNNMKNSTRLGISVNLFNQFVRNSIVDNNSIITIQNYLFSHFLDQKYPELISYNIPIPKGKKIKDKELSFLKTLQHN